MSSVNPILMPKLGLTMTEGTLSTWHVKPGDEVKPGDMLFVVETDKIATDVEARAAGRIESLTVPEGKMVAVGTVVAMWTGPAAGGDDPPPPAQTNPKSLNSAPVSDGRIIATPLARRLAKARAVALRHVSGSGPRGRIKADDVLAYAKHTEATSREIAAPSQKNLQGAPRREATGFEKTVAKRLSVSKQQIPHFYVMAEADLTELRDLRARLNRDPDKTKISVNHFILLAVGCALHAQPSFSQIWQDDEIVALGGSDVGFAVDTPRGLFAPVLRSVGEMRLDQLVHAANDAVDRAKHGAIREADLAGGAITVSNVGMFGASWLVPIINPGQAAIIGVGAIKPQYRPGPDNQPQLRQILALVLAADHRVIDGVKGAGFLNIVVGLLEEPFRLLR